MAEVQGMSDPDRSPAGWCTIHNSDFGSVEEAKAAICRYFDERNRHFPEHPRRAGKRVLGKEREPPEFFAGNNCKDPRYR